MSNPRSSDPLDAAFGDETAATEPQREPGYLTLLKFGASNTLLIKRGIIGNYHHVSREYLPFYLNDFSFRLNNRKNPDFFDAIIARC